MGWAAGPFLFALLLALPLPDGLSPQGQLVLACAGWMAVWWLSEAIPIPATSLLPLALFPLLGIAPARQVSGAYMDPNVVLFMGGFILAQAISRWGLHRRLALNVLARLGSDPSSLVLGFMLVTAFLSMWVSNTATALLMLPIATAVLSRLEGQGGSALSQALLLGVAYSASIGGVASLIGTPPNLVLASQFAILFPESGGIGFLQWMKIGVPLAAVFIPLAWLYLVRPLPAMDRRRSLEASRPIREELERLGPMSRGEKRVAALFALTALGWIFRRDIELGGWTLPGWASLLGVAETVHDSTVAIVSALLILAIPVDWRKREFLLDWESAAKIPWGVLILFGGGIALAGGVRDSGLAAWIGGGLSFFSGLPDIALIALVCLMMTFLTEVTSNTAVATVFMPILAGLSVSLGVPPYLLMVPAAISASFAFMLPVATPPNAIVFASEKVTMEQMSRAGLRLNLIGAILTTLFVYFLADWVFAVS